MTIVAKVMKLLANIIVTPVAADFRLMVGNNFWNSWMLLPFMKYWNFYFFMTKYHVVAKCTCICLLDIGMTWYTEKVALEQVLSKPHDTHEHFA